MSFDQNLLTTRRLSIASVGSDIDKKVKKKAAKGESAWEGMGQAPEVRVWRIEKFQVKHWPKEQYGEFFKGDSYISKCKTPFFFWVTYKQSNKIALYNI